MKKVIALIDGQNLYYGLKDIGILEKDIKWDDLFKSLLSADDELIRTYWFRPQKILDSYYTASNIRNHIVYQEYRTHCTNYNTDQSKIPTAILQDIEEKAKSVEEWLKTEKTKFSRIEYNYDQISLEYEDIEIVKTGVVKVNPYRHDYIGEKGVDIALAVKMIALSTEKKCDKIILVSGDYDYAEAIKYVKNNMTKINIVKIHKGIPPKNKSMSRDLAVLADKVIDIYESELKTSFVKTTPIT
ncbi:MAG: NYN domain-containing protein [Ignavibacteriales bacterium]|nr:NYN domain-containing protein [Ignavibacteriales bacterium]